MCVECDGELQTVITKGVGRYRVFDERAAEGRDEQADAYTGHLALGVHPGTVSLGLALLVVILYVRVVKGIASLLLLLCPADLRARCMIL